MKKKNRNISYLLLGGSILIILGLLALTEIQNNNQNKTINSFEECVLAGNPILKSYPAQCKTKEGKTFTENILVSPEKKCETDSDCMLIDKTLNFSCCYAGYCNAIDYSQEKWIAVNQKWFNEKQDQYCPPIEECGPAPGCPTEIINDGFEAKCIQNQCVKR